MPVKTYKPTSPGKRHKEGFSFSDITRKKPEKSLLISLRKKAGRNNQGKISARHKGGGRKRRYRLIDFKRDKKGIPAYVASIEYENVFAGSNNTLKQELFSFSVTAFF